MSQPTALMIGGTDRTAEALAQAFVVHRAGDLDAILSAHGTDIEYVLFQGHDGFDAAVMDRLPNLRMISNYGVGYDAVDVAAAVERGVMVSHTPNVLNEEVANTAVMLLLMVARNALADAAYLKAGRWESDGAPALSRSIAGLKVGILGLGRIGKVTAEKLAAFGLTIGYHGRSAQDVAYTYYPTLLEMAQKVDILISIAPGGAATHHIINADVLNALGPDGILINIGRGSVVDEPALIAALKEGRLGSAGLDVFEHEPHVPAELMALPNATLLPHVGSATVETRNAMGDLAVENLLSFMRSGVPVAAVPECQNL